jgi:hypothetical protein
MRQIVWWPDIATTATRTFQPPPWLIPTGIVLVNVALLLMCIVIGRWFSRNHKNDTAKFLARWGLVEESSHGWQLRGSFEGVGITLRLEYEIDSDGEPYHSRYEVLFGKSRKSPHFVVVRARNASLSSSYDPRRELVEVSTGDPVFDKYFKVFAMSRAAATAVLDTELRVALHRAGVSAFDYKWGEMQLADCLMNQIYAKDSLMSAARLLCARATR